MVTTAAQFGHGTPGTVDALGAVLFGKTRRALLGLLFGHPTEAYHLRQIVRLAGVGVGPAQRDLAALTRAGILTRSRQGMHVMFQVNHACPVHEELLRLVTKTVGLGDLLREAAAPLMDRVRLAFVYGSMARAGQHAESDVDVMLVGEASLAEVVTAFKDVEARLGREVNPVVLAVREFRTKRRARQPFLTRVLREPKLFLIGDEHELERLA